MLKFLRGLILTILFFLVFAVFLISLSLKFQLLDANYWINNFDTYNVYPGIAKVLQKGLEKGDTANQQFDTLALKELFDQNAVNILGYINGQKETLTLTIQGKNISIQNLGRMQGIKGIGQYAILIFAVSSIFVLLLGFLLAKFAPVGLIITPIIVFLFIGYLIYVYANSYQIFIHGHEPSQLLIAYVAPALFNDIFKVWISFSALSLGLGIFLISRYNKSHVKR